MLRLIATTMFVVAGVSAQTMPYSLAYVYTSATVTSDGRVTATTVSNTNGTSGHTTAAVVWLYSPDGRYAGDYGGWYALSQATSYLPLCTASACYDGNYQSTSSGTNEYCPIAGQNVTPAEAQDTETVSPFVYLSSVSWSRTSLGRTSSYANFTVTAGKSNNCTATSISLQQNVSSPTPGLKYVADVQNVKSATFSGSQANVSFTNGTAQDNPTSGTIQADGLIASQPCTAQNPLVKSATIHVD
jgi:hypothetical protein